jgi:phage replication O-like protein O
MTSLEAPNYTQVPNALFDHMADMSEAELRCTLALVRQIIGWHKEKAEPISYSQFEEITGMSRQGVSNGIEDAIKRGFVKLAGTGKRGTNLYTLDIDDLPTKLTRSTKKKTDQSTKMTTTSQRSRPVLVNEVDTPKKDKEIKENSVDTPDGGQRALPPIQPHIALIDAYWSGLPGGKPVGVDYPRHVKLAMAMVKDEITPDQIKRFLKVVYDPETDIFAYKRYHNDVIPLEAVARLIKPWIAKTRPRVVHVHVPTPEEQFEHTMDVYARMKEDGRLEAALREAGVKP